MSPIVRPRVGSIVPSLEKIGGVVDNEGGVFGYHIPKVRFYLSISLSLSLSLYSSVYLPVCLSISLSIISTNNICKMEF